MKKLEYDGKVGVFLDHRVLFNNLCKEHLKSNATVYKLKTELFEFRPKELLNKSDISGEDKNEKRKHKKNKATNLVEVSNNVDQRMHHFCSGFLQQLQLKTNAEHTTSNVPLVRCWEETECNDFPTFHGANETNEFKTFQHKGQTYIIPPHCYFYNYNVLEMTKLIPQLPAQFDFICLDPPWRNKYIRRIKRVRAQLAYPLLEDSQLRDLPIARIVHHKTLVAIWCTNSKKHQDALNSEFLPAWNLRLLHSLKWLKLNTQLEPIGPLNAIGQKQPFEMLYLACHRDSNEDFAIDVKNVELLLSIPSIVHSHKPPLLSWLRCHLPSKQPKCLEIFARYLQPEVTAIGLEVLKLMDERLFDYEEQ